MAEKETILMKGNEAIAHAAIRCGADAYFGYPITPQSEVIETLAALKPWEETGMVVLQAESEVASINMVYGAAGAGKRVLTSSSSPGVALMQEGIAYMAGAEIPGVFVNVQRGGPGLGTIQPSQADYFQATRGGGNGSDDGDAPDFDPIITGWDGQKADDAAMDIVGTNEDIYWEANGFGGSKAVTVTVTYSGSSATVTTSDTSVEYYTDGAYVTIDMLTHSVKNVEIVVSGKSDDGQLKIYGEKKFKLTLSGVELTSSKGPAINDQCKKRAFVHLTEGTTNRLTDAATYSEEPRYLNGGSSASEDRKGCFFSEGNLIFSGTGVLEVKGNYKHGIVTDGYFYTRPGVTIAVTGAAKNAIHVKGDQDDGIGVYIAGGLIYANVSSTAGKGIKTDLDAEIVGGKLLLNTSGNATYDEDEKDTSSSACIKTDGSVIISGGTHTLKSTGTGGKGINADGEIRVSGGETTVTTTGGKYTYSSNLTSSPKGVKADGNITISGGKLNISVTGASDGSEGLESKATLTISGGEIYSYAYDDAINAASAINITGGKVYAYASNNDGIDSNGSLVISGGTGHRRGNIRTGERHRL